MRRVATNLCLDRLRKKRELPLAEKSEDAGAHGIDSTPHADTLLTQRESMAQVQGAIAALPERQRAAITLCHFQEMSQVEAARVLDISVHAYESLLSRARRTLRERLKTEKTALLTDFGGSLS
jgi:RNA polymerase sigma-70 factor (ECF subfamily)